jgi:glutamate mutase epsilon subunit
MTMQRTNQQSMAFNIRHTTSLFPLLSRHPFINGMGRISISGGCMSYYMPYLRGSNYKDIARDWNRVGMDIKKALENFSR